MLDFFRNLLQSKAERQAEQLTAYLDQKLTPAERQAFEHHLKQDPTLASQSRQQANIKAAMGQLPRHPVPHNFILDPTRYAKTKPVWNPYPVLRTATAVMAILFVAVFAFERGALTDQQAASPAIVAFEPSAAPEMDNEVRQSEVAATVEKTLEELPAPPEIVEEPAEESSIAAAPTAEFSAQGAILSQPTISESEATAADAGNNPAPTPTLSPSPIPTATAQPTATPLFVPPSPIPFAGIELRYVQWILGLAFLLLALTSWYFRRR